MQGTCQLPMARGLRPNPRTMIRARELEGRALVDLETADRLGEIEQLILDPHARRVAGMVVNRRDSLLPGGPELVLPAAAVHAVGPDVVTIRHSLAAEAPIAELADLPRAGELRGRKVVTHGGVFVGAIDDVLLDEASGQLIGYTLGKPGPTSGLESLFGGRREASRDYVRADADLRMGESLVVVPDDAVVTGIDQEPRQADGQVVHETIVWSSNDGHLSRVGERTADSEATLDLGEAAPRRIE